MAGCKDRPLAGAPREIGGPRPCSRPARFAINIAMTMSRSGPDRGSQPRGDAPAKLGRARDARLSAALRANLSRRKVQARARKGAPDEASAGDGDEPHAADRTREGSHDSAGFVGDKRTGR
jgi:hypothetical protein